MEIKDIENLAELAKIDLSQSEKESLSKDLESILGYIKQIEEVKTTKNEVTQGDNVWREDETTTDLFNREFILNQFPDSQDGFVKVKKIL
ncbi:MAG: Asp-tRNA(Asn)/Glu-tRNA(Gln) amidotransferase subunit GatC [Candidatus Pacebacteria bacterium]|nr:Asp-tRNA(Asn)/Glu-tRNA(Gln) amidotransferase subunit GatC [Candidatus Paceibacterota bacterium]MCF7862533.1 Asp-tRNA(Asn)/Glu-tRNA(Gln) amidotransferase subunit GatC [Candidatus Paceibacterota bacterium]